MREVDAYLEEKVSQKNTRKLYRRDLEQFRIYLEKDMKEAVEEDFKMYFSSLSEELELSSLRRKQSVIRKFYQYLLQERKILKNPFPIFTLGAGKKSEKEKISQSQYEELLETMEGDLKLLTQVLWETGAKLLDLYDVKVQSLMDYRFQKIVGTRQGKVYSYNIPESLREEFQKRAEEKEKTSSFFEGNRQQYDKELKKRNQNWNASKIKKEVWTEEKIDLESVRRHYFEIGIGDK